MTEPEALKLARELRKLAAKNWNTQSSGAMKHAAEFLEHQHEDWTTQQENRRLREALVKIQGGADACDEFRSEGEPHCEWCPCQIATEALRSMAAQGGETMSIWDKAMERAAEEIYLEQKARIANLEAQLAEANVHIERLKQQGVEAISTQMQRIVEENLAGTKQELREAKKQVRMLREALAPLAHEGPGGIVVRSPWEPARQALRATEPKEKP